ncbi:hypothetical protein HEK616_80150 (plasmid) [Streptomyces nigrescens]|uniref:Uncharacterized protein n=1 Tax=Streptomyces nigrescens TaxID=1920 RepID=A0ABM8A7A4_STRNI|nr:hypothetical protein HEK616_80150 [Streptomyces nigrescens]
MARIRARGRVRGLLAVGFRCGNDVGTSPARQSAALADATSIITNSLAFMAITAPLPRPLTIRAHAAAPPAPSSAAVRRVALRAKLPHPPHQLHTHPAHERLRPGPGGASEHIVGRGGLTTRRPDMASIVIPGRALTPTY